MSSTKLRVGFDLDGVLLYNPARIARPIVTFVKQRILKATKTRFFVPTNPFDQWIWRMLHYTSLFKAQGFEDIKQLVRDGKVEAYIITGRYGFLENDFEKWLKKINATQYFRKTLLNKKSEQPHVFKLRTIKELNLDVFVEDNWDIVQKLKVQNANNKSMKVLWIYNILDRNIAYDYKFSSLKNAVRYIASLVNKEG